MGEHSREVLEKPLSLSCSSEQQVNQILVNFLPIKSDPLVVAKNTKENDGAASVCGNLLGEFLEELSDAISKNGAHKPAKRDSSI